VGDFFPFDLPGAESPPLHSGSKSICPAPVHDFSVEALHDKLVKESNARGVATPQIELVKRVAVINGTLGSRRRRAGIVPQKTTAATSMAMQIGGTNQ
jgi:hypothetical protein